MGIRITKMAVSNGNLNTVTRTLTKEIRDLNLYSILNPPPPTVLLPTPTYSIEYIMESLFVCYLRTRWYSTGNRTSERTGRVIFLIQTH